MRSKFRPIVGIFVLLFFLIPFLVGIVIILQSFFSAEIFQIFTEQFIYWFESVLILIIALKFKIAGNYVVLFFLGIALFGAVVQPFNLEVSNIVLRISLVGMMVGIVKYILTRIVEIKKDD